MAQLSFHKLYDAHHRANSEDLPFWLALAEQHPDPFLELGCGTGRVLIPLASQGRKLVGIDRDALMLELLRQRLPVEYAQNTHLIQADFTRFALATKFNLIFMPCNTYSTLSSAERTSTLGCVRQHLLEGGTLALSLPNPELFKELPARSDYELEEFVSSPRRQRTGAGQQRLASQPHPLHSLVAVRSPALRRHNGKISDQGAPLAHAHPGLPG